MAANQNFTMVSGDNQPVIITVTNRDKSAADLTNASVKWVLKKKNISPTILTKTTGAGITVSGSDITINLLPADTQDLSGVYYHECEVTEANGKVSTVTTGYATIQADSI